ncbi:MAG TPA: TonB family protein [Bryobacteraceae bacterium]|nr:TonB family protein [Bryobacteraceae bacterium]
MLGWNEAAWFSLCTAVAVKSTAVLAAGWFIVFLMRRRSAAARHLVWTAASAAVLALPLLSLSLPVLRVPSAALPSGIAPILFQVTASTSSGAVSPAAPSPRGPSPLIPAGRRVDWRLWLMLLAALGSAAIFLRTLVAAAGVCRLRRSAKPFLDRVLCDRLARLVGVRQPVDVLETKPGAMPMTCGFLRPAVLLPADATEWSEERRRFVLLHELAHVRRGDLAAQAIARMALTFYWWNPLAWAVWRGFLKERERAADDVVLNAGASASEYAANLLEVARTMQATPAAAWAGVPMARRSQLEGRLLSILDSAAKRKAPDRTSWRAAAILAVVLVAPLAAMRAQEPGQDSPSVPVDVDAAIRSAQSQRNYDVLETAAKAAERLRKYDAAQKLLEAAVAMRGEIAGEQSPDYGIGLMRLADLEKMQRHGKSAESLYARSVQILGERPEAAAALLCLGTAAILNKHFPQAIQYFEHAGSLDPAMKGRTLMWSAIVRQREQNPVDAETLFKNALSAQDGKSKDAAITMKLYAQFLREQGRDKEANELFVEAMNTQEAVAAAAAKPTRDGVYRVGNGVQAPGVLQKVDPSYTDEARAAKLSGTVILSVEIGTDGLAHNARVMRGLGLGLDESAMDAISQWHFRPGLKDNQPVTVAATIEVNFRLL